MLLFSVLKCHVTDSVHHITNLLLTRYKITIRKSFSIGVASVVEVFQKHYVSLTVCLDATVLFLAVQAAKSTKFLCFKSQSSAQSKVTIRRR